MSANKPNKLILARSLALVLVLGACSSQQTAQPKMSMTPTTTPSSTNTPDSEFQIPSDFPDSIPVHPGEVVLGSSSGEGSAKTWAVEVLIDDLEQDRLLILDELQGAGFELVDSSGIGTNEYLATLTREDYKIMLKVYLEAETNEHEVRYVVISL